MSEEIFNQETGNEQESSELEKESENLSENVLGDAEKNETKEEQAIKDVETRISESDQEFQQEAQSEGIINKLGDKIKESKLLRAASIGFALYNASPALAAEIPKLLGEKQSGVEQIKSEREEVDFQSKLDELESMPDEYKDELSQIYDRAPDDKRELILKALESKPLTDREISNSDSRENIDLLVLQQNIIDLQNSGEMGLRKKGGVILHKCAAC